MGCGHKFKQVLDFCLFFFFLQCLKSKHRVLRFGNPNSLVIGMRADSVVGQPNFTVSVGTIVNAYSTKSPIEVLPTPPGLLIANFFDARVVSLTSFFFPCECEINFVFKKDILSKRCYLSKWSCGIFCIRPTRPHLRSTYPKCSRNESSNGIGCWV